MRSALLLGGLWLLAVSLLEFPLRTWFQPLRWDLWLMKGLFEVEAPSRVQGLLNGLLLAAAGWAVGPVRLRRPAEALVLLGLVVSALGLEAQAVRLTRSWRAEGGRPLEVRRAAALEYLGVPMLELQELALPPEATVTLRYPSGAPLARGRAPLVAYALLPRRCYLDPRPPLRGEEAAPPLTEYILVLNQGGSVERVLRP